MRRILLAVLAVVFAASFAGPLQVPIWAQGAPPQVSARTSTTNTRMRVIGTPSKPWEHCLGYTPSAARSVPIAIAGA